MATSVIVGGGFTLLRSVAGQIRSRLFAFGTTQRVSCIHTSAALDVNKNWDRKNLQMFPPQQPDEARRPAEVYHCRRQIKYSKDKMWYLANMIRGMTIDEAIAQLEFNDKKGAKIMKEGQMLAPICHPRQQRPSKTKTYLKVTALTVAPSGLVSTSSPVVLRHGWMSNTDLYHG
ncbi:large ribosomal subunit protein uL22m-like isoform 2-T2 [Salvelinus alpinus]